MSQHHHHHEHHEHHEPQSEMSFDERLIKRLEHWLKHNEDHAATYREWSEKVGEKHMDQTASLLRDAAEMTLKINQKIGEAIQTVSLQK